MSRLDSFIRRMQAQRACLGMAAELVAQLPGPVLELGLGNGRTYDHLRELFPQREIFVFENRLYAHPDCLPDDAHLVLGDARDTLPTAGARIGAPGALAHSDLGSPDPAETRALMLAIAPALTRVLRPGAVVVSGDPIPLPPGWRELALPPGVAPGRYHIYRNGAG